MFVEDFGGTDAFSATDRSEFGECLIELARARAAWEKEIELFSSEGHTFRDESDAFDRRLRRILFDMETQESEQSGLILADGGDTDPAAIESSVFQLKG